MTVAEEARPDAARARFSGTPVIIGLIGFLTLVDLFAAQAILPSLAARFNATPAQIGFAANASTIGMAAAGLLMAFIGGRFNRKIAVWVSLAVLSIPTVLLSFAPDLSTFMALRIVQGVFMVAAFSMTMSYLAERCSAAQSATALAAYVTGVVASNLVGRLVAGLVTDAYGVSVNFYFFAALNLAGAVLAFFALKNAQPMAGAGAMSHSPLAVMAGHLRNRCLLASFGIGFLILFAFIGVFTYVNFVLARAPISLSPMSLGLVYFVFVPSMLTTPIAGKLSAKYGARLSFYASLGLALAALPLLLSTALPAILIGLALVGVGTFFAQATATGFVGRAAKTDRAAASGMYLSSYYLGGLAGSFMLGKIFEAQGWAATVVIVAVSIVLAALLATILKKSTAEPAR
ncbi:MAG: MFS transporter [Parvularculaceae bacterium]